MPRLPLVLLGSTASCVSSGPLSLKRGKLVEQTIPLAAKTGLGPVADILISPPLTFIENPGSQLASLMVWVTFMVA